MAINAAAPTRIKGTSITAPSSTGDNHALVLGQLKETTEIAQRLRGDPNDSFVKISELNSALGTRLVNNTLQPPNTVTSSSGSGTVSVADSITGDGSSGSPLQLSGDSASPGNSKLYGTNSSGVKGWYAQGGASLTSPLTTKGDLWGWDTTNNRIPVGANDKVLTANSAASLGVNWAAVANKVGAQWVQVPFGTVLSLPTNPVLTQSERGGTILEVRIYTIGGTGSCVVDIWKAAAGTVPTSGNDITGGVPPQITSGTSYLNSTLTSWTTSVAAGDVFLFTLASVSGSFTNVTVLVRIG